MPFSCRNPLVEQLGLVARVVEVRGGAVGADAPVIEVPVWTKLASAE
ncbi:MAG: hypothetical protein ABI227_01395 [Rhodanobacter sp.]